MKKKKKYIYTFENLNKNFHAYFTSDICLPTLPQTFSAHSFLRFLPLLFILPQYFSIRCLYDLLSFFLCLNITILWDFLLTIYKIYLFPLTGFIFCNEIYYPCHNLPLFIGYFLSPLQCKFYVCLLSLTRRMSRV